MIRAERVLQIGLATLRCYSLAGIGMVIWQCWAVRERINLIIYSLQTAFTGTTSALEIPGITYSLEISIAYMLVHLIRMLSCQQISHKLGIIIIQVFLTFFIIFSYAHSHYCMLS